MTVTSAWCGTTGVPMDAHHIIERRLWPDGGYYLDNGVTVCEPCHLKCEQTVISPEELRTLSGIGAVVLPEHLYSDQRYDKWGNPVLQNGQRLRGELFHDVSVQKVLRSGGVLNLFTDRVKYPRTYHLPWSPGKTDDDRVMSSLSGFVGKRVVATVKLDGENTTMYHDGIHARSLEYTARVDRDRVKAFHASLAHDIHPGWRICGENVWAQHSIAYQNLESFFYLFSVWDDHNRCLQWDETVEWAALLGLAVVPVIYDGPWDELRIRNLYTPTYKGEECEGHVVRVADGFQYSEFRSCVGKYVRAGHVRTQAHWTRRIVPNTIRSV